MTSPLSDCLFSNSLLPTDNHCHFIGWELVNPILHLLQIPATPDPQLGAPVRRFHKTRSSPSRPPLQHNSPRSRSLATFSRRQHEHMCNYRRPHDASGDQCWAVAVGVWYIADIRSRMQRVWSSKHIAVKRHLCCPIKHPDDSVR